MATTTAVKYRNMRYGDLSSEAAPKVAVRLEAVVYNFGKVNLEGKAFLESTADKGFNVLLLTLLDFRKMMAWCYKWGIPYTQIIEADSTLEIPDLLKNHHVVAYFDTDDRLLSEVRFRCNRTEAVQWQQEIHGSAA